MLSQDKKSSPMKNKSEISINHNAFKNLYADLVEKAAIAILVDDEDGNLIFCNKVGAELHGYTLDEIKGKPIKSLVHPDDLEMAMKYHKGRIAGDIVPSRYEFRGINKDGSTIYLEVVATALRNGDKVIGTRSYLWDMTDRKKTEAELLHALAALRKTSSTIINVIGNMLELRDPYTADHHRRVAELARAISEEIGLPQDQIDGIRIAGLVHDIGKISIPAEILSKPSCLSSFEMKLIEVHPQSGYELLKNIDFPWPVAQIVLQHHERIDGSGYPSSLKDNEIILGAKILGVADVVEAMSSHRPYRAALGIEKALKEMSKNRGILYDSKVVDTCIKLFKENGFAFRTEAGGQRP